MWGQDSCNEGIYGDVARGIVEGVVEGYNGTVFAYGQTSSGKTHTLTGSPSDPGITPRAIHNLFDILYRSGLEFMVRVSYIEIYNEELNE